MRAATSMILFAVLLGASLGIGLAVPAPLAAQALERLEATLQGNRPAQAAAPATEPGYLGLITDDRQDRGFGVRVMEVIPGGPALAAGLQEGDLIIAANGAKVRSMDDLAAVVQKTPAGGRIAFDLLRGQQMVQANVTLGKRPAPGERRFEQFGPIPSNQGGARQAPAAPPERGQAGNPANEPAGQGGAAREPLGITVGPATAQDRQRLNLGFVQGVLVVDVVAGSAAARGGVLTDDMILSVGGVAVTSADDLAQQLNQISGEEFGVVVLRQGRPVELLVRWAPAQPPAASAPGQSPRPAPPPQVTPGDSQAARIEALERRVAELEAQLQSLQQRLDKQP